jgi:hypothetical protein
VVLENVAIVPEAPHNIFSLTRALKKGTIRSKGETIIFERNGVNITFDKRIDTANGFLPAAPIVPMNALSEKKTVEKQQKREEIHEMIDNTPFLHDKSVEIEDGITNVEEMKNGLR